MSYMPIYRLEFKDNFDLTWRVDIEDTYENKISEWTNSAAPNDFDVATYATELLTLTDSDVDGNNKIITSNIFPLSQGDNITIEFDVTNSEAYYPLIKFRIDGVDEVSQRLTDGVNTITYEVIVDDPLLAYDVQIVKEADNNTDIQIETKITVDPVDIEGTSTPLRIDYLSSSEKLEESTINGSTAEINIYSSTDFQWNTLYDYGNLKYRVSVYYDTDTLYWRGFINSESYQEPYDQIPYPVIITASDALGQLKRMDYVDGSGDPYTGRKFISEIIHDILEKINIDEFYDYINLYETSLDKAVTDSMLDQVKIDVDVFEDMNCYEVLYEVLKTFNSCIRQYKGDMILYRPFDLAVLVPNMPGRKFTDGTTKAAASNIQPRQYINRTTNTSDIHNVEGGTMRIEHPSKLITVNQDYGDKESWVYKGNFLLEDYDATATEFVGWSEAGVDVRHISQLNSDESNGVALSIVIPGTHFNQDLATNSVATSVDYFTIEFDYGWFNDTGVISADTATNITVYVTQGLYYLKELGGFAEWTLTPTALLDIAVSDMHGGGNLSSGYMKWFEFKKEFGRYDDGLHGSGVINIELHENETLDIYNCYRNIKFTCSNSQIMAKKTKIKLRHREREGRGPLFVFWGWGEKWKTTYYKESTGEKLIAETTYEKANTIEGVNFDYDYMLGDVIKTSTPADSGDTGLDNIVEQFAGSLAYLALTVLTPTSEWSTSADEEKILRQLIGDEIAAQYASPRQKLSIPIVERNNVSSNPQLNVIGYFEDELNKDGVNNKKFVFNSGTFDVSERKWSLELIEIN